jgi:DNA gyrase/topoisomerase IV subunit A
MIDKKDAQWWVLEAQKNPDSAVDLIRMLADRLAFLDKQNEELRAEVINLKRKQRSVDGASNGDDSALKARVRELESALQSGASGKHVIVYGRDRIELNTPISLDPDKVTAADHELTGLANVTTCGPLAKLFILTDESQVFAVSLAKLPVPQDGPAVLGNPDNVIGIFDQAIFERYRFMALLSEKGYLYSILTASLNTVAKQQGKLLRSLIPGDPIVAAIPSYNADLFVLSKMGRWARLTERSIASTGSPAMQLPKGDSIAGVASLNQESDIVCLTVDGRWFVRNSKDLKAGRSASGMLMRGQSFLGVGIGEDITVITQRGLVLTAKTSGLPAAAQTESGAAVKGLAAGDRVVSFEIR